MYVVITCVYVLQLETYNTDIPINLFTHVQKFMILKGRVNHNSRSFVIATVLAALICTYLLLLSGTRMHLFLCASKTLFQNNQGKLAYNIYSNHSAAHKN